MRLARECRPDLVIPFVSISGPSSALRPEGSENGAAQGAGAVNPALAEVAAALRGARARTGMSEEQVIGVLAEQGLTITVARLRGWERTGVVRIDSAMRLADIYGITIDTLAGRRAFRSRNPSRELPSLRAGP